MNTELQELQVAMNAMREELSAMKDRLGKLEKVVNIHDLPDGRKIARVRCHRVTILDEKDEDETPVITMGAAGAGGHIWINRCGEDSRRAVSLGVNDESEEPEIRLLGPDGKQRALLFCENDHGTLALLGPDNAAGVAARARPGGGGSVAVLQKDGKPRAVLVHSDAGTKSGEAETDLIFATATGKTILKLHADEGGGLVTVGMPGHADGVVLTMRDHMPAVMLRGPEGASSIHLLASAQMACVKVMEGWLKDQKAEASLMAGSFGSSIGLNECDGSRRVDLSALQGTGSLCIKESDTKDAIVLAHHVGNLSSLTLQGPSEHESVRLLATQDLSALKITSPTSEHTDISAQAGSSGPQLLLRQDDTPQVLVGSTEHGGILAAYGREEVQGGVASLSGGPRSGQLAIAARDGTNLMTLDGTDYGGRLLINNDLGFQRALLGVHEEGALLALNNTGTPGVQAVCTELGGVITLHDQEGEIILTIPQIRSAPPDDDEPAEET